MKLKQTLVLDTLSVLLQSNKLCKCMAKKQ